MSGVAPEIRLGSEPGRVERWSNEVDGGRATFGEAAFVERALAILARQSPSPAAVATGPAPGLTPQIPAPFAPAVSAVAALASPASPLLPQVVPPYLPPSLAQALPAGSGPAGPVVAPAMVPPATEALRQQAIAWIDTLLALVTAGVSPTAVKTNLVNVGAGSPAASIPSAPVPAAGGAAGPAPPAVALPVAAAAPAALSQLMASAGQTVATTLRIANDRGVDAPIRFVASDLVGDSGARIPSSAVAFAPAVSMVAAYAVRAIEVFVAVPAGMPPGTYTGLLQLIGQPLARSLLSVDVKPAAARGPSTTATASTPGGRA